MRLFVITFLVLFSPLAWSQVAAPAFVPENGFWWAPSQPGRGFAIEQQDDDLFITVYTYSDTSRPAQRAPIWYSAQGSWSPPRSSADNPVYRFSSPLSQSDGGQCIGCPFRDPVTEAIDLGLAIAFDSPWSGTMELGPESIEIERFWFSSSLYDPTNVMLGQWKLVRDYSEANDDLFPFEADVLIFDDKDRRNGTLYAEG